MTEATGDAPRAVLDTNSVLAGWWFRDPAVAALGEAVESRAIVWVATPAMRQELAAVLQRGLPRPVVAVTADAVLQAFDRHAVLISDTAIVHRLLCTDRSDQIFIDLAVGQRVQWLFSRDRAVLKLRRRAQAFGVSIVRPDGWQGVEAERERA